MIPVMLCPVGLQTYNFLQLAAQQPNFKGDSLENFIYCRWFKRWNRDFSRHGGYDRTIYRRNFKNTGMWY
jgi:hypothetical protein